MNEAAIEIVIPGPVPYAKTTVRGETPQQVQDLLEAIEMQGLYALIGKAQTELNAQALLGSELGATPAHAPVAQGQYAATQGQGYQQPQGYGGAQAPAQTPQGQGGPPPGVTAPTCPHGVKRWVDGKYGPFWGCAGYNTGVPREQQCKPQKA